MPPDSRVQPNAFKDRHATFAASPRRKSFYDFREKGHDEQRSSDKFRFEPVATDRTNEKIGISTLLVVGQSCFFRQEWLCCAGS
jgi:hypothetical protein